MSTTDELDVLLYAWLSEPEARRAELRFNSYFQAAFPAICRYIRSLRTDPATAQDIAQHALIKLFKHLGTGRRAADERVREAISVLRPLDFGALHARGIDSWRRHVWSFRDAAISFRVPREPQDTRVPWKESRDEINGRILHRPLRPQICDGKCKPWPPPRGVARRILGNVEAQADGR